MQQRPFVWLTAPSGYGKSFLTQDILEKILDGIGAFFTQPSEAGIARELDGDSIPVVLDEFDPTQENERQIIRIMESVRTSTYGKGGERLRATGGSRETIKERIRYSILCASINLPSTLTAADRSRLIQIKLSEQGVDDWPSVRDEIYRTTTSERMTAIRTHIIRHTRHIAEAALSLEDKYLSEAYPTRQAQILASLSAGYGFLINHPGHMIRQRIKTDTENDAIYRALMGARIRYHDAGIMIEPTVGETICKTLSLTTDESDAENALRRVGIRKHGDGILMALRHEGMKTLLRGSPFQNIDLENYLRNLPDVELCLSENGDAKRIRFAGIQHSAVLVPVTLLEDWGPLERGAGYAKQENLLDPGDDEIPF